jgi:hypothetical protein
MHECKVQALSGLSAEGGQKMKHGGPKKSQIGLKTGPGLWLLYATQLLVSAEEIST